MNHALPSSEISTMNERAETNERMKEQTNKRINQRFVGKFSQIFHSASDAPHALMHGGRTNC